MVEFAFFGLMLVGVALFFGTWLAQGWHITLTYVVGFFVLLALLGWQPTQ